MTPPELHPGRTALLVMDMQQPFLRQCCDVDGLVARINPLLDTAREAGALIVFVRVAFRPGYPELAHGLLTDIVRPAGILVDGSTDTEILPELHRTIDDLIIDKHRTSALYGNDLNLILRARGIDTLVLTGFSTAGVVLSTMNSAFDQDYRILVPDDCCSDPDPQLHDTLVAKLFPHKGTVLAAADLAWAS